VLAVQYKLYFDSHIITSVTPT